MENKSIFTTILTIVGFIVVATLLMGILGGILGFALHILVPMAIVVWLVRFIFGSSKQRRQYYR